MGYQNTRVCDVIDAVQQGTLVLPAIQRNFVWDEERICGLFDSLMKGYPVGAFLYWTVGPGEFEEFVFNSFISDLDKESGVFRGPEIKDYAPGIEGVLDGQQRITSLLVGLTGSYTSKVSKARKVDGKNPKRYLSVNLLKTVDSSPTDDYELAFLSDYELEHGYDPDGSGVKRFWAKISEVAQLDAGEIYSYVSNKLPGDMTKGDVDSAMSVATALATAVNGTDALSYYVAGPKRKLTDVVEIFERVNSRGQSLTGTDLMLSMASVTAGQDMQRQIDEAIKKVAAATGDDGFVPDKAFILTAGLMAIGAKSISTTARENYKPKMVKRLYDNWQEIVDSICNAAVYVSELGFNGKKIRKTYMHPIAYYFYKRGDSIDAKKWCSSTKAEAKADRKNITQWLLRAQIKQIFVEGSGATLLSIRDTMDKAFANAKSQSDLCFPLEQLRDNAGARSLEITEDDVNNVLEYKSSNPTTYPLLVVLLSGSAGNTYEIDHMWPQATMRNASKIRKLAPNIDDVEITFYQQTYDRIENLQLLLKTPNQEKSEDPFDVWAMQAFDTDQARSDYYQRALVPKHVSLEFANYREFFSERKRLLREKMITSFDVKPYED